MLWSLLSKDAPTIAASNSLSIPWWHFLQQRPSDKFNFFPSTISKRDSEVATKCKHANCWVRRPSLPFSFNKSLNDSLKYISAPRPIPDTGAILCNNLCLPSVRANLRPISLGGALIRLFKEPLPWATESPASRLWFGQTLCLCIQRRWQLCLALKIGWTSGYLGSFRCQTQSLSETLESDEYYYKGPLSLRLLYLLPWMHKISCDELTAFWFKYWQIHLSWKTDVLILRRRSIGGGNLSSCRKAELKWKL